MTETPASERFAARDADWRCGPIVYHVFVDRFAPPANLDAKRHLYPEPKVLKAWGEPARVGPRDEALGVRLHELEFWGGDLDSLRSKLDYIEGLGADVLYLNPIHAAWTNHKYDAHDWSAVSPEYGSREDVAVLAADLHDRGMRLMLDGVFNHVGRTSELFQRAMANPDAPERAWFDIDPSYKHGYRAWFEAPNLPEVAMERDEVKARVYRDEDSVVRGYLAEGVDGWRLDVAYDYGPEILDDLTRSARLTKPDAWIVGEIWNDPAGWIPACDGVMNMHLRRLILMTLEGRIPPGRAGRLLERHAADVGDEGLLRCWNVLDNHDTPRLATTLPRPWERELAQTLQFTLPGAPLVYYGVEAGMTGDRDPEMRGPMDWDRAVEGHPEFDRLAALVRMRRSRRALRVGDLRVLDADRLLAFARVTDRVLETVYVFANPSAEDAREVVALRSPFLMNSEPLVCLRTGERFIITSGMLDVRVPPRSALVLAPEAPQPGRYSPYKRVP